MSTYSFKQYTGDGVQDTFSFPFGYLDADHIAVTVDGESVTFTLPTASTVQLDSVPDNGTLIEIRRSTPADALADFSNTSTLTDDELEVATTQALYLSQEAFDEASNAIVLDSDGHYTASSKRIKDLAAPVADNDAVRKADLEAAEIAAGNVPTPGDPADDGKALIASGGSWAWTAITVAAASISDSTAAGRTLLTAASATAQRTALGLGDAALATIGVDVQAFDADILKADTSDTLEAGYLMSTHDLGEATTGTITPDFANGNAQQLQVGGSFTLACPAGVGIMRIEVENTAGSAVITFSGFDYVDGEYDDTNGAVMTFEIDTTGRYAKLTISEALTAA